MCAPPNPRFFANRQAAIERAQFGLEACTAKGAAGNSTNVTDVKRIVAKRAPARAKLHEDARNDFLSRTLARSAGDDALIATEAVQIVNMAKSAKGTVDKPRKHVRQKAGLNREILAMARLRALNARALRALPPERLSALLATAMQRTNLLEDPIPAAARRWIDTFLAAYGTDFTTLGEALALVADLRAEAVVVPALELEKLRNRQVLFFLDAVGQYVDAQPELRDLPLDHDLAVIAQEFGIPHDDAFAAVRLALTGKREGAPLTFLFPLLGHDRILIRIGAISSHLLHGRGLEPIKYGPGGVPFKTIQPTAPHEP